jgi:decaprenylphospho-beta-D-ribofuranose 2-oxidase
MRLADPAPSKAIGVRRPSLVSGTVAGWGGLAPASVSLMRAAGPDDLRAAVTDARSRGAIARGMGRSYGDAAQLRGGLVLDLTGLTSFELDAEAGLVTAQGGVTLGRLLHELAPAGWVLPVVPGTQHVSVGGAIASDIHGKNHGSVGTFGHHVQALGLLTAAGDVLELTPDSDLFMATLGGMGLTGVILWARIALTPLRSAMLSVDTDRVQRLDDALAALLEPGGSHRVAWLDLLSSRTVRGVVTRAQQRLEPAPAGEAPARTTVDARMTVPARWPGAALRPELVRAYNAYRYLSSPRRGRGHPEPFGTHMFPLDVLTDWPRLYGARGFVQYQLVVPRGQELVLELVIERLRNSPVPCLLAVLKDFGPANGAHISFPIEGWTLALDLPRAAPRLESLMRSFDDLVAEAGGRVYLAKDARLRPDALAAMYPRLGEWRAIRDQIDPERVWRSDLALRAGLIETER